VLLSPIQRKSLKFAFHRKVKLRDNHISPP
jgi:hypothetical protein